MIFRQANLVLNGTKSQHRLPLKEGEELYIILLSGPNWVKPYANMHLDGAITAVRHKDGRLKYAVGKDYAIQPPNRKSIGRFQITGIRCEHLRSINLDDVVAEGYCIDGKMDVMKAKNWYKELWNSVQRHSEFRWKQNPLVCVMHMRPIKAREG